MGAGPFVDGLRLTTAWALAAAVAITSLTTLCCAWRWSLVAGGLGVDVPLRTAVSAYYRSQFLNSTLPGGVLGDVHRGVLHGRAVGDLGRAERVARGVPPTPIKVTVTSRAQLDPCAAFFATGDTDKLVYCPTDAVAEARSRLGAVATVVDGGRPIEMCRISEDLRARGVSRLMVEGGGKVLTQFLTAGLADELHLVVAPFFVGDFRAQRFVGDGSFPWNPDRRAELAEVHQFGNVVLLRYALSDRFD